MGQRPVLILIHCGASSQRMFRTTNPLLESKGFTCLTPDIPGYGINVSQGPFTFEAANIAIRDAINNHIYSQNIRSFVLIGISLGGQVALSFLQRVDALLDSDARIISAIVSSVSIHPPDNAASWEMPHMPTEQEWLDIMMEDVHITGMENMHYLQAKSFDFTFHDEVVKAAFAQSDRAVPPIQVMVGVSDIAMARRDVEGLSKQTKLLNNMSETLVLKGA